MFTLIIKKSFSYTEEYPGKCVVRYSRHFCQWKTQDYILWILFVNLVSWQDVAFIRTMFFTLPNIFQQSLLIPVPIPLSFACLDWSSCGHFTMNIVTIGSNSLVTDVLLEIVFFLSLFLICFVWFSILFSYLFYFQLGFLLPPPTKLFLSFSSTSFIGCSCLMSYSINSSGLLFFFLLTFSQFIAELKKDKIFVRSRKMCNPGKV